MIAGNASFMYSAQWLQPRSSNWIKVTFAPTCPITVPRCGIPSTRVVPGELVEAPTPVAITRQSPAATSSAPIRLAHAVIP